MTINRSVVKPARIQFASDLHLEFEHRPQDRLQLPVARGTTALVLAGDIHSTIAGMDDFVRNLAKQVPVVMVAGNHEFFTHELNDTRARARRLGRLDPGRSLPGEPDRRNRRHHLSGRDALVELRQRERRS